nr:hypothetical protein [Escherichia coli]
MLGIHHVIQKHITVNRGYIKSFNILFCTVFYIRPSFMPDF